LEILADSAPIVQNALGIASLALFSKTAEHEIDVSVDPVAAEADLVVQGMFVDIGAGFHGR